MFCIRRTSTCAGFRRHQKTNTHDCITFATLLAQVRAQGELVVPVPLSVRLPHADDEPFLEVAKVAMVEFLVTGNLRHFAVEGRTSAACRVATPVLGSVR